MQMNWNDYSQMTVIGFPGLLLMKNIEIFFWYCSKVAFHNQIFSTVPFILKLWNTNWNLSSSSSAISFIAMSCTLVVAFTEKALNYQTTSRKYTEMKFNVEMELSSVRNNEFVLQTRPKPPISFSKWAVSSSIDILRLSFLPLVNWPSYFCSDSKSNRRTRADETLQTTERNLCANPTAFFTLFGTLNNCAIFYTFGDGVGDILRRQ